MLLLNNKIFQFCNKNTAFIIFKKHNHLSQSHKVLVPYVFGKVERDNTFNR